MVRDFVRQIDCYGGIGVGEGLERCIDEMRRVIDEVFCCLC